MADMISIILIIIFGIFTAKKLIIPRIIAARAAKAALSADTPFAVEGEKRTDSAAAIVSALEHRPVTFIDVREVSLYLPDNDSGADRDEDKLSLRMAKVANEMLLNASLRGRNVQFGTISAGGTVILYTTYTT